MHRLLPVAGLLILPLLLLAPLATWCGGELIETIGAKRSGIGNA